MRRQPAVLFKLLLMVGVVAVPVVLTWREVRQEQLNQALIAAVERNDLVVVRALLRQGADPNAQVLADDGRPFWERMWDLMRHRPASHSSNPEFALMAAVDWRPDPDDIMSSIDNAETVKALIEAGARVNFRGRFHERAYPLTTPLNVAAYRGKWQTMNVLIAHHTDVNAPGGYGLTPLMMTAFSARTDMVEMLLKHGADVNAQDSSGGTALIHLCCNPAPETAKLQTTARVLLRHGASVRHKDSVGHTAIYCARTWGDAQLISLLRRAGTTE